MKYKWLLFLIIPISAFADDLILSDIQNGCSSDLQTHTFLFATFTRKQYQCSPGYYLPANNDGCVVCPEYYDCDGGTFTFNEYENQGNKFKTFITEDITGGCRADFTKPINSVATITATYEPNTITITWDDGTNTIQNTCDYDGDVTLPPTPTRPGYVFNGWRVKEQPVPAVP